MRSTKKSAVLTDSCISEILADCRALMEKHHFSEDEIDLYRRHVVNVLDCYRERFGGKRLSNTASSSASSG